MCGFALSAAPSAPVPAIPDYLREAAERYNNATKACGVETIQLALRSVQYAEELGAGMHGGITSGVTATEAVREALKSLIAQKGDSVVSRYLNVALMARFLASNNIKLDRIRSQGCLYAMLPSWESAAKEKRLGELVDDASTLSIAQFQAKWRSHRQKRQTTSKKSKPNLPIDRILAWVNSEAKNCDLEEVYQAVSIRLEALGLL